MKYVSQITSPYDAYLFQKHMKTHRKAVRNVQPRIDSTAPFCHAAADAKKKFQRNTISNKRSTKTGHQRKRPKPAMKRRYSEKLDSSRLKRPSYFFENSKYQSKSVDIGCFSNQKPMLERLNSKDYHTRSKEKDLAKKNEQLVQNILHTRPIIDTTEPPKLLEPINYAYRKHRAKHIQKQNLVCCGLLWF